MNRIYSATIGMLAGYDLITTDVHVGSIYAAQLATVKEPNFPLITIESDARGFLAAVNRIGSAPLLITAWSQVSLDEAARIMKNSLKCIEERSPIRNDELNLTFEIIGNPTFDSVNEGENEPISFRAIHRINAVYFFK